MINLSNYIIEELLNSEQGNNVLIDNNDNYSLYCGKHLFDRLKRHEEITYNSSDIIKLSWIKTIVNKGFSKINSYSGVRLNINDPNSCINLISKKHGSKKLNVLCYIKKIDKNGKINIIIKTTMFNDNFKLKYNEITSIVENLSIYEIEVD